MKKFKQKNNASQIKIETKFLSKKELKVAMKTIIKLNDNITKIEQENIALKKNIVQQVANEKKHAEKAKCEAMFELHCENRKK